MIDDKTPNLQLPLPNKQNLLSNDVERIAQALTIIDAEIKKIHEFFDDFKRDANELREEEKQAIQAYLEKFESSIITKIVITEDELKKTKTLALVGI